MRSNNFGDSVALRTKTSYNLSSRNGAVGFEPEPPGSSHPRRHAPETSTSTKGGFLSGTKSMYGGMRSANSSMRFLHPTGVVKSRGPSPTKLDDSEEELNLGPTAKETEAIEKAQTKLVHLQDRIKRERGRVFDYKETIKRQETKEKDLSEQLIQDQIKFASDVAVAKEKLANLLLEVERLSTAVRTRREMEGQLDRWLQEGSEEAKVQRAAMVGNFVSSVGMEKVLDPKDVEPFEILRKEIKSDIRDGEKSDLRASSDPAPSELSVALIRSSYVAVSNELSGGFPSTGDDRATLEERTEQDHLNDNFLLSAALSPRRDRGDRKTLLPSSSSIPGSKAIGEDRSLVGALINAFSSTSAGLEQRTTVSSQQEQQQQQPHRILQSMLDEHLRRFEDGVVNMCLEDQLIELRQQPSFESFEDQDSAMLMPHIANI